MTQKSNAAPRPASPRDLFAKAVQQYQSGQLKPAEQNFLALLAAEPGLAAAEHGLALVLVAQGKTIEALAHFQRALALKPDFAQAFNDLAQTLFKLAELGQAAEIIKRNPAILRLAEQAKKIWPARLDAAAFDAAGGMEAIANDSFLLFFLGSSTLGNAEIEQFLTGLRAAMLARAVDRPAETPSPAIVALGCALARQCFINEYVFSQTPGEKERANALRERVASMLAAGTTPPVHQLAALAS